MNEVRLAFLDAGYRAWDGLIYNFGGIPRAGDSITLRIHETIQGFQVIHVTWNEGDVPLIQIERIKR